MVFLWFSYSFNHQPVMGILWKKNLSVHPRQGNQIMYESTGAPAWPGAWPVWLGASVWPVWPVWGGRSGGMAAWASARGAAWAGPSSSAGSGSFILSISSAAAFAPRSC